MYRVCVFIPEQLQTEADISQIFDLAIKFRLKFIQFDFVNCVSFIAEFYDQETCDRFEDQLYTILPMREVK